MQNAELEELATKLHLWQLYQKAKKSTNNIEMERLLLNFLKEKIKLGTNCLSFYDDVKDYEFGNCYTYALGLTNIRSFTKRFTIKKVEDFFSFNVGFMDSTPYFLYGKDKDTFLLHFLKDCQALNIKVYETDEQSENIHGGYKIALYFSYSYGEIQDFHFLRQNEDGVWSHKRGYYENPQLTVFAPILENWYEHFKTYEIVKPVIRERIK